MYSSILIKNTKPEFLVLGHLCCRFILQHFVECSFFYLKHFKGVGYIQCKINKVLAAFQTLAGVCPTVHVVDRPRTQSGGSSPQLQHVGTVI